MADVISGTHAGAASCRRKVYTARPTVGRISTESRHLWIPLNVAREVLHVVPYGNSCDCLRVAQLQILVPSALLTAGSHDRNGASLFSFPTSA